MPSEVTRRAFLGAAGTAAAVSAGAGAPSAAPAAEPPRPGSVKIIGVCTSPRKGKTTATSLKVCLDAAKTVGEDVEVELIELAGMKIPGAPAAGIPLEEGEPDDFPKLLEKLSEPNVAGIIVGTPVYFGNMSSLCKAFLDRCIAFRKNDFALSNKVGGVVAVGGARNGGQELTIRSVQTALMGQEMIIVGDGQPTSHWGATVWSGCPGGVTRDEFGMSTARNLGRRVADVALRLHSQSRAAT